MNSLDASCNELKKSYDACFNVWFSEQFLKGRDTSDAMCQPLLVVYQECVRKALKVQNIDISEVDKQVLGTPEEKQSTPKS